MVPTPTLLRVLSCLFVALGSAATGTAQCPQEVLFQGLDAGVPGPFLRTPDGAPVVGGPFSTVIEGAAPNSTGVLVYSGNETSIVDVPTGANIYVDAPFEAIFFTTDAEGRSGPLLGVPEVTDLLCGTFVVMQGVVFDTGVPAGLTVTDAIRLRVGAPQPLVDLFPTVPATYVTGGESNAHAVADLDGDGEQDVVLRHRVMDQVGVLRGAGGGLLDPEVLFSAVSDSIDGRVLVPDLDGDGLPDVVLDDEATVLLNDGAGALGRPSAYGRPLATVGAVEDLDGDGFLDLAIEERFPTELVVRTNAGDGTFGAPAFTVAGPGLFVDATLADLDDDGRCDMVLQDVGNLLNDFNVYLGDGDGTFTYRSTFPLPIFTSLPFTRVRGVYDLNADGALDLVFSDNRVTVKLGRGNGGFGPFVASAQPTGSTMNVPAFGDVTGDGLVDLASLVSGGLFLFVGIGDGTFDGPIQVASGLGPSGSFATVLVDLDGDGFDELCYTDDATNDLLVLRGSETGLGAGTMATSSTQPSFMRLVTDDLDGDGIPDVGLAGNNYLEVYPNQLGE